jgi:methylase of polypeptide subunit release factors
MKTAELELWPGVLRVLHGMLRLRWLRLAMAGWHFQVDAVSLVHDHIWDGTSFVMRKGIRRYAHDGDRVLDLGTGHLGLLAVYCARTHQVDMVAVDVNKEFVENAMLVAAASLAPPIDFRQSDWFSHVDGTFDLIFANVPYIPTGRGASCHRAHEYPEIWDGGNDGLNHERTVLTQVAHFLRPKGLLMLGIDTVYIPRVATLTLIERSQDLDLREIIPSWVSPSEIYVIGLKAHPSPVC